MNKYAVVGLIASVLGLAILLAGAFLPVSGQSSSQVSATRTITVAGNDYLSQNLILAKGSSVQYSVLLKNQTVFFFYIMNQTQYYNFYGCAPTCYQPLLGGNGSFSEQAGEVSAAFVNQSLSAGQSYSASFQAPSNGTYYFVFDNSLGANPPASYVNATGDSSTVDFTLVTGISSPTNAPNWLLLGPGAVILVGGGAVMSFGPSSSRQNSREGARIDQTDTQKKNSE